MAESESKRIRKEFSQRLNHALDELKAPPKFSGRQTYLARLLGKTQKGVRRWLEAECLPRPRDQERLAKSLHVRLEWLMFGLGSMNATDMPLHTEPELLQRIIEAVNSVSGVVEEGSRVKLITALYERLKQPLHG